MDTPAAATGFVVWITRDAEGGVAGTVERVRTGEKHRFRDLEVLGALIDRMTARPGRTARSSTTPKARRPSETARRQTPEREE